jgi:dihydrofolate reductase
MIKSSVFIATSLDGFIARKDGSIDWLDAANASVPPGTDLGYESFITGVDALVMGRKTFETALSFPQWPYGSKPVIVISHTFAGLPDGVPATVSLTTETPETLVRRLESEDHRRLYVDGGRTIQSFLRAGLIDEMTITIIPVLLGEGIPLFGQLSEDLHFTLVSSRSYDFGFVQNTYRKNILV